MSKIDEKIAKRKEQMEKRKAKNKTNRQPSRFRLAQGETKGIIILDAKLDNAKYWDDHKVHKYTPGKYTPEVYEPCLEDEGECPLCNIALDPENELGVKVAKFGIGLTIIEVELSDEDKPKRLSYYKTKDGEKRYSKKILKVNVDDSYFDTLRQRLTKFEKKNGTIRGCMLKISRPNKQKSPTIGELKDIQGETFIKVKEATIQKLLAKSAHKDIKTQEGELIAKKEELIEAFEDFYENHIKRDPKDVLKQYDDSYDEEDEDLDDIDDLDDEDDIDDEEEEEKKPKKKKATRKSKKKDDDDEDDDIEDDEDDIEDEDEDDDIDDDDEDLDDDEDELEEEDL